MEFVTLSTLPGIIGRYLMMLKVTDILDIAIMVFVFYKALTLIQSTRAASLLKGVLVFLAALMLSMVLNMNSINFIMNQLVRWGVVALIVLFQPEIRRILEEVGSRRFIAFFSRAEAGTAVEQAIDQTVLACTEMSQSRTGALIVFERENLLDDMVRSGTVLDAARDEARRAQVDKALALAKAAAAQDSYAAAVLLSAYEKDKVGAAALLADFRAVAAAGLRGSPRAPVQGDAARKALAAADAAIQRLGAQVNPKITLSVLAMKFRTF